MIGIMIIAHGTLGESLIHCASHVMGRRPECLLQLGVTVYDEPSMLAEQAQRFIKQLDQGDGVLIFSDVYGATPCNIVTRLLQPGKIEAISGVNLPMLLRALNYRNEPLEVLIKKVVSGGRDGIIHLSPWAY